MDVSQRGVSPVSLIIPCRSEYVSLCRLVAGALGTRDSLDEDVVADLKVLVTEACNCFFAMASASAGCSIRLDFDSRPDEFVISLLYPENRELVSWLEDCDPVSAAGLGLIILKAVADEIVELDGDGKSTILRLTKRLPA